MGLTIATVYKVLDQVQTCYLGVVDPFRKYLANYLHTHLYMIKTSTNYL